MMERITCPNMISDGSTNIEFSNGSTFKLVYHFYSNENPDFDIKLDSFDLSVDYWIYGYEDNIIHFDKSNISNEFCIIDKCKSLVKFIFKDYNLNTGKLMIKATFTLSDKELGNVKEVVEGFTGIILK